ncbi:MAG: hypothetical protein BIFFINMI_04390 [Phycisphaerae bacterium]|nr:hypothetical protein [Phycisphaerae bacterium]
MPARSHSFDVVVVGGGCSGVAAAVAAARSGARTALIEASSAFGGMATCGMVPTLAPFTNQVEPVVRGVGLEVLNRLLAVGGATPKADPRPGEIPPYDWTRIDAEKLKRVMDEMIVEAGVVPRLFTMMAEPTVEAGRIVSVSSWSKSGLERWHAPAYVDCTGDADLAARAGCPFQQGDRTGRMQPSTLCFLISGLRDVIAAGLPTNPFRSIVREASLNGHLSRPNDHLCINGAVTPQAAGFNYKHQVGTDGTDADSITRAAMEGRRLAHELCDYLRANVDGCQDAFVAATASLLGVRETRRIVGEYTITIDHYFAQRKGPDDIADYCREIDVHTDGDLPEEKDPARVEHFNRTLAPGQHYGIPLWALIPRGVSNLLVAGRAISTDRQVQGSTRQMPCTFATGQAAGAAAAQSAATAREVRALDIPRLQETLRSQGAFIDLPAGVKA